MRGSTPAALRFMRQLQRRPGGGRDSKTATSSGDADMPLASPTVGADTASGAAASAEQPAGAPLVSSSAVGIRQLSRLTLATDDAASAAGLSIMQGVTSSYDLLAIQPLSERVLQQVSPRTPSPPPSHACYPRHTPPRDASVGKRLSLGVCGDFMCRLEVSESPDKYGNLVYYES